MSLRQLPEAKTFARPKNYQWDAPGEVLARWAEKPLAAEADDPNTISIYDVIGEDPFTGGGFTAKRAAAALRAIGKQPVTLKINSPGGDLFEGIAIYNLFREHPAAVNVDVMGWAASAASIVAMAGDRIQMGLGTFMMVHNAWGLVIGNRHDMADAAKTFEGFDSAIADIYQARTQLKRAKIEDLMDGETIMGARDAVENGFADAVAEDLKAAPADPNNLSEAARVSRRIEGILAQAGVPRVERRRMLREIAGTPGAAGTVTPGADLDERIAAQAKDLIATILS